MEEGVYLNASQRAIIAARMANRPGDALKNHLQDASIEAPISQSEAARRLRVGRSSVQRAASLLKNAAPELVAAVEAGLIMVSTASRLLALPKIELSGRKRAADPLRRWLRPRKAAIRPQPQHHRRTVFR
jgi:hypothetical protein